MKIRKAELEEISEIKKLIDSFEEMDVVGETFPEEYYQRILKKGILLVAVDDNEIVGVCFGAYNIKEKWADLLGLVVKAEFREKGIGTNLVKEFEKNAKDKELETIDLYADKFQLNLFEGLGYIKGRPYTAFRKKL